MICETFSTEQGRRGRQDSAVARNACHHQHGPFFPGVLGFGSFSFQKRGVAYYSLKLSANVSGLHGCRGIARGQDIPYMACILSTCYPQRTKTEGVEIRVHLEVHRKNSLRRTKVPNTLARSSPRS